MTHLVNKWNDKTNTFQFDSFEITMTLEDVARITGLKCDGSAVLLRDSNYNAREKCTALLGMSMDEWSQCISGGINSTSMKVSFFS